MKDFAGTPGTLTALVLRISQCIFAAGSIAAMATTSTFFNFTAFCTLRHHLPTAGSYFGLGHSAVEKNEVKIYLVASMGLQVIWSFGLALLDAYSLVQREVLNNSILVSLFVVGDWVTATLSLAAASASAGITVLLFQDVEHCSYLKECEKYQISVALAFLSWGAIAISSLIMLWLLAAG